MKKKEMKTDSLGRYRARVTVGQTPEGKPIRKPVYAYSKAELKQRVKELKEAVIKGEVLDQFTTVEKYAQVWLDATVSPSRHKSYEMYSGVIKNHIVPRVGSLIVSKATPIQIQTAITKMEEDGIFRTADIFRMTLIQIFESAIDNGLAIRNPAKRTKKPDHQPEIKQPLSEREIEALLEAPMTDQQRLFVLLGLFQGLRKGEALGLLRGQTGDEITISQAWTSEKYKSRIKPSPKTVAGNRTLQLLPMVKETMAAVNEQTTGLYLFSDKSGQLLSPTQYLALWKWIEKGFNEAMGGINPIGRRKGLQVARPITSHYLRHTFCTMLYYAGFNLNQTMYLMGHNDAPTTIEVYTHLDRTSMGIKDRYQKWVPMLRQTFLGERPEIQKGSKKGSQTIENL